MSRNREIQKPRDTISERREQQRQHAAKQSERNVTLRKKCGETPVPRSPQVGNERYRKPDHSIDGDGQVINVTDEGVNRHHHQQKNRGHGNSCQISAQQRMLVHEPSSKVVQERGNQRREKYRRRARGGQQGPVKPRHSNFRPLEPAQHFGPKIAAKFEMLDWRQSVTQHFSEAVEFFSLQRIFHPVFQGILHGCTPARCNFFRNKRTARNMRSFTAPAEIPNASPIFGYVSSSINPSCATTRRRGGNSKNALRSATRVCCCTAESGFCWAASSSGRSTYGRLPRRWSSARFVAMRRSHEENFASGLNRPWALCARQKVSTVRSSATAGSRTMRTIHRYTSRWYCRKSDSKASRSPAVNRCSNSILRRPLSV